MEESSILVDFGEIEEPCPVTQRAPMAHLASLIAQTQPPPVLPIEELSPDDLVLLEDDEIPVDESWLE